MFLLTLSCIINLQVSNDLQNSYTVDFFSTPEHPLSPTSRKEGEGMVRG